MPTADAVVADLVELLRGEPLDSTKPRAEWEGAWAPSRSADGFEALTAWVMQRLQAPLPEQAATWAWQLIEKAVRRPDPEEPWVLPETDPKRALPAARKAMRPLLSARVMLHLGEDYPTSVTDPIPFLNNQRMVEYFTSGMKDDDAQPTRRADFTHKAGDRHILAGMASPRWKGSTSWRGVTGPGSRKSAEVLFETIDELMRDPAVRAELGAPPFAEVTGHGASEAEAVRPQPADQAADSPASAVVGTDPFGLEQEPEHISSNVAELEANEDQVAHDSAPSAIEPPRRHRRTFLVTAGVAVLALVVGLVVWRPWERPAAAAGTAPVTIVDRAEFDPFGAVVSADIRDGDRIPDGAVGDRSLPKSWNALSQQYEVALTLKVSRADVVLTGFKLTRQSHDPLDDGVTAVSCECGGNGGPPSGFTIEEGREPLIVPFGRGSETGRMRLYLTKGASNRITLRFKSTEPRITTWAGELLFQYGPDLSMRAQVRIGPIRTATAAAGTPIYQDQGDRWGYIGKTE